MEITELNLISNFEAGINCLQNPSLISQILPISTLSRSPQIYSLCKWGALIIAVLAAFSGLISRIKFLILKIFRFALVPAVESIKLLNDDDFEYDDDDTDDDDTCSSVSSDEEEEEREGFSDVDFSVAGGIGRQFSWSDFAAGKSVVRLWDNLTTAFDCDEEKTDDDVVSLWGFSGKKRDDPVVVLSAEKPKNGGVLLALYDNRVRKVLPEMTAAWPSLRRRAVAVSGGVGRFYVRDDVTGVLTVGDLRNVRSPLERRAGSGASSWWDADAVIVSDEFGLNYRY